MQLNFSLGSNIIFLEMENFIPSADGYDQSDVPSARACLLLLLSIKKLSQLTSEFVKENSIPSVHGFFFVSNNLV